LYANSGNTPGAYALLKSTVDANASLYIQGGLYVGTWQPTVVGAVGVGDIIYVGGLKTYKNSTTYAGYIGIPLSTPLGSTSYDGDAFSSDGSAVRIDLSTVFGAPAGIKGVILQLSIRDTSTSAGNALITFFNDGTSPVSAQVFRCVPHQNQWISGQLYVPCDSNGDIYRKITAGSGSSFEIYMYIIGYQL